MLTDYELDALRDIIWASHDHYADWLPSPVTHSLWLLTGEQAKVVQAILTRAHFRRVGR